MPPGNMSITPLQVHDALLGAYGPQNWWPGETRIEIVVGAVLTQSTNWRNVSIAIGRLREARLLELGALLSAPEAVVKEAIRPSGFYNVKYGRLMPLLHHLGQYGLDHARWSAGDLAALREELLNLPGIGPETGDAILLYAFDRPTFVVDAYARRLLSRLGLDWAARCNYSRLRAWLMGRLPHGVKIYNEMHALIVQAGKRACRPTPRCSHCPLLAHCPTGRPS